MNEYEKQKLEKEIQKAKLETERNGLITERDTLKYYYDKLAQHKRDCDHYMISLIQMPESITYWRGSLCDSFKKECEDMGETVAALSANIDDIMDAVNMEITRHDNQINKTNTNLDGVLNTIRYLQTMIENARN